MNRALTLDDILAWPYVMDTERRCLPDEPGIYCAVIDRKEAGYVGMASGSLRLRWQFHHRLAPMQRAGCVTIAYLVGAPSADLVSLEREAIAALTPRFNVRDVDVATIKARDPLPLITTSGGLIKSTSTWTPEQFAWLREQAREQGRISVPSLLRQMVQAAMDAKKRDREGAAA